MDGLDISEDRVLIDRVLVAMERVTGSRDIDLDRSLGEFDLDSVVWLELVMQLERMFHIHVPDDQIGRVGTVRDVVELVRTLSVVHSA
jgi:acyl carrier protein